MQEECSFGIIPCRKTQNGWEFLLVQLHAGHWGFPKGHSEEGEDPLATAIRELYEETKLSCTRLIYRDPITETYQFHRDGTLTHKTVSYFLAQVDGEPVVQPEEIQASGWFSYEKALDQLTFPESKRIAQVSFKLLENA